MKSGIYKIKNLYNQYKAIPVAARAGLWFVACTMLQKCIAFITVPIFTRLMPTNEYGLYSTYLSWYSIMTTFCTLNMHGVIYVNSYTKANSQMEKNRTAIPLLSLSICLTTLLFVIYLLIHRGIDQYIGMSFPMVCLLFIQIMFEPPVSFWSIQQRFEYKYVNLVIRTVGMVVLNAFLGIGFVYLSSTNQALARVISIVLVQILFGGFFYLYFWKRANIIFSTKGWFHALKVQLPLLPHGLSLTILSSSDRIMISQMIGSSEAGVYSVAYSAAYVVNVLKNSVTDALTPWIYDKIKNKDYCAIRDKTKPITVLIVLITILFTAFAPEIVSIMAPKGYREAMYIIPPVAASTYFTYLYNTFSSVSFYYEKTKRIMFASIGSAILNIFLNVVFIRLFGYIAAGYTTLVCYIFLALAHYLIMKKTCKEQMEDVQLFDLNFILLCGCIVLLTSICFTMVYSYTLIRYCIIIGLGIFMFAKRNWFITSVKMIRKRK